MWIDAERSSRFASFPISFRWNYFILYALVFVLFQSVCTVCTPGAHGDQNMASVPCDWSH